MTNPHNHPSSEYTELIARLEAEAIRHPTWYRARVLALAMIGHAGQLLAGLLLVAAAMLAISAALSYPLHPSWFIVATVLSILAALLIMLCRITPATPRGELLTRDNAPNLFRLIDKVATKVGSPTVNQVLLTVDFNAAIIQQPRLGAVGWHHNILLLGLPLMLALSTRHFAAVLAHEFGHLSAQHGRFACWVYRLRNTWQRALERHNLVDTQQSLPMQWLHRFVHYFNAYSFVLARQNEYEADQASVTMCGKRVTMEALVLSQLASRWLEQHYWPALLRNAEDTPEPTPSPHRALEQAITLGMQQHDLATWLQSALTHETGHFDTHPSLRDRLEHLGHPPALPEPISINAARRLLGNDLDALQDTLDEAWRQQIRSSWQARHRQVQEGRRELDELQQEANTVPLSLPRAWRLAELANALGKHKLAIASCEYLTREHPEFAPAHQLLGQLWLSQNDHRGLDHLDQALRHDPRLTTICARQAYCYLQDRGDDRGAESYFRLACEFVLATEHRDDGTPKADIPLLPHDLPPQQADALSRDLANDPFVEQAWLLRRSVTDFPERSLYLMLLQNTTQARSVNPHTITPNTLLPNQTFIIKLDNRTRALKQRAEKLSGSQLFP
ncbi:M48 family metallopeptidase [Chitinivorax sp. B]|uniref:M48 family metallopeptidase n=1 Tax=Chitinivorax sp. B TaxID=2502235 RepID=UPI0010F99D31|nr:M48 family metallopeptidase [Chitinivorax sp. B]